VPEVTLSTVAAAAVGAPGGTARAISLISTHLPALSLPISRSLSAWISLLNLCVLQAAEGSPRVPGQLDLDAAQAYADEVLAKDSPPRHAYRLQAHIVLVGNAMKAARAVRAEAAEAAEPEEPAATTARALAAALRAHPGDDAAKPWFEAAIRPEDEDPDADALVGLALLAAGADATADARVFLLTAHALLPAAPRLAQAATLAGIAVAPHAVPLATIAGALPQGDAVDPTLLGIVSAQLALDPDPAASLARLSAALAANPTSPRLLTAAADHAHLIGNHSLSLSLSSLAVSVSLSPADSAEALYCQGRAAAALGDADLSLSSFFRSVKADEHNAPAHLALGQLYAGRGELRRAVESYEAVLSRHPSSLSALLGLSWVHLSQGALSRFSSTLERAALLSPKDVRVLLLRLKQGELVGDWSLARSAFASLLSLSLSLPLGLLASGSALAVRAGDLELGALGFWHTWNALVERERERERGRGRGRGRE
jgi:tetratricopeptide (TPR) repeat protein